MTTLIMLGSLSAAGFLISLYFFFVHHKLLPPDSKLIPTFCRMDEESCLSLLSTRDASLFGIPNSHLGLLFCLVILFLSFNPNFMHQLKEVVVLTSAATVLVGVYLAYSLLLKYRVNCVLCFAGDALNLFIFIILVLL